MSRILPFIIVILAIGLFFGYVKPTWDGEITTARSEIDSYNSALAASDRFSAKEAALEQERDSLPADGLARLNTFLPDSVDNIQLILDLNALAQRSGMTLSNFTTSAAPNLPDATTATSSANTGAIGANASPVDYLTLSVNATGTYASFRKFLSGVEQSLRPLDVTTLTVNDSDTGVYTYQMTLKFYWLH
jgi:hypothetical protein